MNKKLRLPFLHIFRTPYVMDYEDNDVLVAELPFFRIYGQVVVMLSGLLRGFKLVTQPKFDPELYLQNVQEHQVCEI